MKASDHLRMYLEACSTSPDGRQAILADEKVRQELVKIPVNGKALVEAVYSVAKELGPNGGNVADYLNTAAERRNFLQYFDGWNSIEDATNRVMA
jgi:hypothetical protein